MGRGSVLKIVFGEALALGVVSSLDTIILAGPVTYYFATHGIRVLDGKSVAAFGSVVDPVLRGEFGGWFFGYAVVLSCLSTLLASVYPAWFAVRLEPAEALRVD
jgi:ABC-type lipoprotein release transport system permease subunit